MPAVRSARVERTAFRPFINSLYEAALMTSPRSLEQFLTANNISSEDWTKSGCNWEELCLIASDHESNLSHLRSTAEMLATAVQGFPDVHSVRWRVKDVDHVLGKIVRKRVDCVEKYATVSAANYREAITDLIGIRALHLYKEDCFSIHDDIKANFEIAEQPVAYIREGDAESLQEQFRQAGFSVQHHKHGYRSVHYVVASKPMKQVLSAEIQVRTIFEEGWSEIDHRIRYPNFSDDPTIGYFLQIFNRMSGSADEMGGFVKELAAKLGLLGAQLQAANVAKQESLTAMEDAISKMERAQKNDAQSRESLLKLREEMNHLKSADSLQSMYKLAVTPAASSPAMTEIMKQLGSQSTASAALDAYRKQHAHFDEIVKRATSRLNLSNKFPSMVETVKKLEGLPPLPPTTPPCAAAPWRRYAASQGDRPTFASSRAAAAGRWRSCTPR